MALAVCILLTWIVIIILFLMPKTLSERDMVFLFFINTIFELSIFTVIHLNLKLLEVGPGVEKPFADLVLRLIMIPLLLNISANAMRYPSRILKWGITAAIILVPSYVIGPLLVKLGVLIFHNWSLFNNMLLFAGNVAFSWLMTWFITKIDTKEAI